MEYTKGKKVQLSKHFCSTEFDCQGGGCCHKTLINPKLVELLENIREHFGKPITITSGYRCPSHNAAVGGAAGSRHTKGDAADIVIRGITPLQIAQYAESIGVKGIGLYSNFTHVDTRDKKSFWYGHSCQPRNSFGVPQSEPQKTVSLPLTIKGHHNVYVMLIQSILDLPINGNFDAATEAAVKALQKKKGLAADGMVGEKSWQALLKE